MIYDIFNVHNYLIVLFRIVFVWGGSCLWVFLFFLFMTLFFVSATKSAASSESEFACCKGGISGNNHIACQFSLPTFYSWRFVIDYANWTWVFPFNSCARNLILIAKLSERNCLYWTLMVNWRYKNYKNNKLAVFEILVNSPMGFPNFPLNHPYPSLVANPPIYTTNSF